MENIKVKHREYEVNQIITQNCFLCSYKNKEFLVKKYDTSSENLLMIKKMMKSNIKTPNVKVIDKKSGYVVIEYIDGILMSNYILENDFTEDIYKQIFRNSYMARVVGLNLDYSLDKWMIANNVLYYVGDYCEKYNPNFDFTKTKMREWFFTSDLAKYYEKNGILFDKNRIKSEFTVNKEMVLMTCKYYL